MLGSDSPGRNNAENVSVLQKELEERQPTNLCSTISFGFPGDEE